MHNSDACFSEAKEHRLQIANIFHCLGHHRKLTSNAGQTFNKSNRKNKISSDRATNNLLYKNSPFGSQLSDGCL